MAKHPDKMGTPDYLSLCYHYIRPEKKDDLFPDILGLRGDGFRRHIQMLQKNYRLISLDEALQHSRQKSPATNGKLGMLMTFDDGLSDHFGAAEILADHGISGVFFVCTCALIDRLPNNPAFIHYAVARYRLSGFLAAYRNALEEFQLNKPEYAIPYVKGQGDPWVTINAIKKMFKYQLSYHDGRKVLMHIYKNTLLKDYPNANELIHLTHNQIKKMVAMGHRIGVHSHSHISVAATQLSPEEFKAEVVAPKHYLEKTFQTPVIAFSYPFGQKQDCLSTQALIAKTHEYQLAFTVETIVNTQNTSPFELGRYMPMSTDDDVKLKAMLDSIVEGSKVSP